MTEIAVERVQVVEPAPPLLPARGPEFYADPINVTKYATGAVLGVVAVAEAVSRVHGSEITVPLLGMFETSVAHFGIGYDAALATVAAL